MNRPLIALAFAASSIAALTGMVLAKNEGTKDALPPGSVSRADGLTAWQRIEAVVTHPRCANCHVDAKAIPIWTPAGENRNRVHGMNIHGGASRIGAETIRCSTCCTSDGWAAIDDGHPPLTAIRLRREDVNGTTPPIAVTQRLRVSAACGIENPL